VENQRTGTSEIHQSIRRQAVRVKNKFTGKIYEAKWSFKDSASIYAQPVLLLEPDGKPVDAIFFEVLDEGLSDPRD
jgi:hypothetical protein